MTVHNFYERLAMSQDAGDEPFWDAVYQKAFPDMAGHVLVAKDSQAQRLGIDRFVTLYNGRVLRIDEKKREAAYNDILLEYLSNDRTNAPGWMEKDLQIDYLAYAFMPTRTVYLFDWLMLKRAWRRYKSEWLESHRHIEAKNNGYKTMSVAVPIPRLRAAVSAATIITLDPDDITGADDAPYLF